MTDLKEHLKVKTENYRQLSLDLQQARDNLSIKKREARQASEALGIAESNFRKAQYPQPSVSHVKRIREDSKNLSVAESLDTIREKAKESHEAFNQATAEVKKLETALTLSTPSLLIARSNFVDTEATDILRDALSQAGLLNAIQQSLTLLTLSKPEMGKDELQKLFFKLFFNALLIDETIPHFDNSLNAINERLN
ncbi:MAG: hypothetical protein WCK96_19035 [Methylococcales bacterium]